MNPHPDIRSAPPEGCHVFLICQTEDRPDWAAGVVRGMAPFELEVDGDTNCRHAPGQWATLIWDSGRGVFKGHGRIARLAKGSIRASIFFDSIQWELADSRDYPRYPVELDGYVRSISDSGEAASMDEQIASVRDLSLGGALVAVGIPISRGQLVELGLKVSDAKFERFLCVVAHSSESTGLAGLCFLDPVGAARDWVRQLLMDQAA